MRQQNRRPHYSHRLQPESWVLGHSLWILLAGLTSGLIACHTNPHFSGLKISEVRYVRGEETGDVASRPFVELSGPAGFSVGGAELRIYSGSSLVRTHTLPAGTTLPADGHLLISNFSTVKASNRTTDIAVDVQVSGFSGWDWLPAAFDSGVTLLLDDPAVAGELLTVVDGVRYNPAGGPTAPPSWWEGGLGEGRSAPELPYFSTFDPAWGLSRVGSLDLDANATDFLVAAVTPGAPNEQLWFDDASPLPAGLAPRISEVMPNTNGFNDENTFVELRGPAGLRWDAGPGTYELVAMRGGPMAPHGDRRSFVLLAGQIPPGGLFVAADSPRLPAAYGSLVPHQQVRCTDLQGVSLDCAGAGAATWDWLGNYQDAGLRLEYFITNTRRIIVDAVRWSPENSTETRNVFRQGEGLAPLEPSSPATSFSRFGVDTHHNRDNFQHADPTPGTENQTPSVVGALRTRYGPTFPHLGTTPPKANGRVVLFDQTKHQKAGATGHWIVSEQGDYTDWAWQLFNQGFTIRAIGTGGPVETLTSSDLAGVHVLVIGEPQRPYSTAERDLIRTFVQGGGSLFFIANHRGADRDSDGWDAWRIWNEGLDLDALTGVELVDANCIGENLITHATAAAAAHPILTDVETPSCAPGPTCSLTTAVLFRAPGVGVFSGAFVRLNPLPAGISAVTPLLAGNRPAISRDPHRLDSYGGAPPTETYAVAIETSWGAARIVLLGDSAVLNDGGSSDYATYAASLAYAAYGTDHRNSLFGLNAVRWLAGLAPVTAAAVEPALELAP